MSKVFGLDVSPPLKLLLLALTDHADDDGHNCWPSVQYLVWKTSLSERHVRRMMSELRESGVLVRVAREGGGRGRSTIYRINLDALPAKAALPRERKGLGPAEGRRGERKAVGGRPFVVDRAKP